MMKRNKYKLEKDKLILYPDYGNIKGFFIISFFCLLLIFGLFYVNHKFNHIGITNLMYISLGFAFLMLLIFVSAFKKVVFDNRSKNVVILFYNYKIKSIPYSEILKVERQETIIPTAFYLVLKNDHLGLSTRLSVPFNKSQYEDEIEFKNDILPLINECLANQNKIVNQVERITITRFKQKSLFIYCYLSYQKIILSVLFFAFGLVFLLLIIPIINLESLVQVIFGLIFVICAGLFLLIKGILDFSRTYIDLKNKKIYNKSFFGFILSEISFSDSIETNIGTTSINGIPIYTSLYVISKKKSLRIDKSFTSKRISDLENEIKKLIGKIE